ncbi:hypothetical protein PR202_ga23646 [Eleusine coracana subsp. coracana]|uniref:Uncharacterized protein n=1 Tax=Eleusine coracana subsp. coracana TaxID=191504 RepID=A0AAV5D769_ELECO|nr:hypothetical protein PR202_ga23646 [Eleusine coracana subsp. coracana]
MVPRPAAEARVFLLLNGGDVVPTGRALSVVCLGPRPPGNQTLEYKMEVSAAALSLSASGPVPCVRRWAGHHPERRVHVRPGRVLELHRQRQRHRRGVEADDRQGLSRDQAAVETGKQWLKIALVTQ